MNCPFHPARPSHAQYDGTCSDQCAAAAHKRRLARRDRDECTTCGSELHVRIERGNVVKRCLRCRSAETLSPLVVAHLT